MPVRIGVQNVRHLHAQTHAVRRRHQWHIAASVIEWSVMVLES